VKFFDEEITVPLPLKGITVGLEGLYLKNYWSMKELPSEIKGQITIQK
jgi:hypothetical protein